MKKAILNLLAASHARTCGLTRSKNLIFMLGLALTLAGCSSAPKAKSPYVKVYGDTLKVNTTELGKDIEGFKGPVPLEVSVVKGRIADIKILDNIETPRFLARAAEGLLPKWKGLSVKKAAKLEPDAVSGATYSSDAIIRNMNLALAEFGK